MEKSFIIIPLCILFILASCGNPIIEAEYGKVSGLGDDKVYFIRSTEDVSKLHAHPDGTFIFDINDEDIEMDSQVAGVFTGKIWGPGTAQGMGRILVSGMMFAETDGATIQDIIFFQNGIPDRGVTEIGLVTGVARNTKFINVRVDGTVSTNKPAAGEDIFIGGIAGKMDAGSVITRSSSTATVGAQGQTIYIGGLVGFNEGGEISYSYAHGAINNASATDTVNAGGLAGFNSGRIFDSYYALAGGIVANSANPPNIGGLAGDSSAGAIDNSYSSTGAGSPVPSFAGIAPSTPAVNAYHAQTSFVASNFSSNPNYWSFDGTFQDGDIGGMTPSTPYQILPRLINNPDRFTGSWK